MLVRHDDAVEPKGRGRGGLIGRVEAELVVDGDLVRVDHGELEVAFQGAHDEADGVRLHEVLPVVLVGRVDVHGEVVDPVDAGGLGVAVVVYVVYVALLTVLDDNVTKHTYLRYLE